MTTFAKYELTEEKWGELVNKITSPYNVIGYICHQYDDNGNCINQSNKIAIDILWDGEPLNEFDEYEVFPKPCGVHTFLGADFMYKERYCLFNPLSEFCK